MSSEWANDKAVTNWFELIGNPQTVKNYTLQFPKFLEFVKSTTKYNTPSEILAARQEQERSPDKNKQRIFEDVGKRFAHELNKNEKYRINTKKSYLRTMLSFFSVNHSKLEYSKGELFGILEPSQEEKVSKEWIPTNEEIRLLYRMANNSRDRAILLVLYQSGFSEIDVSEMKIEQFPFYDVNGNWSISISEDLYHDRLREKTNISQKTCVSREALEEIRIMLQSRGFPKEGDLFISQKSKTALDVREINDIFKALVTKAFNGKVKLWKTKHLRDAFMNGLLQARIPQELKDSMVGHKRQGAREDYGLTEITIKTAYNEAFKFLTINGFGQTSRKIEELQQQMTEQSKQDTERFRTLTDTISKQNQIIEKLEAQLAANTNSIGEMRSDLTDFRMQLAKIRKKEKMEPEPFKQR